MKYIFKHLAFLVCTLIFLAVVVGTRAQTFQTFDKNEELFKYEVKTIDEFIERFDDDLTSFLRKSMERDHKALSYSRQALIFSLCNMDEKRIPDSLKLNFVFSATDEKKPQYINFEDSNWYAEANCEFVLNGKNVNIPLILHVRGDKHKGAKWMIAGIGQNKWITDTNITELKYETPFLPNKKYIPSTDHALKFMSLISAFGPAMNAQYYFEPDLLKTDRCKALVQMILQNKIKLNGVTDIKYHFYQLPGFIVDVEYFDRAELLSGWLISAIRRSSNSNKEFELKKLLNI